MKGLGEVFLTPERKTLKTQHFFCLWTLSPLKYSRYITISLKLRPTNYGRKNKMILKWHGSPNVTGLRLSYILPS